MTSTQDENEQISSLHIAPMLDVSNYEFRHFIRILSKKCVLWTEMVVDETIVYSSERHEHLQYHNDDESEKNYNNKRIAASESPHPIICQIGGIKPDLTAISTKHVEQYGYDEINLNIDCPSSRVSGKEFGAILMKKVDKAVALVKAMKQNAESIPISVKTRIGIDNHDSFDYLVRFIQQLKDCGCRKYIIHARKCLMSGLTPAQNRLIPPLNYPRVYALCKRFPDCEFIINGGIPGLKAARQICYGVDMHQSTNKQIHSVPCSLCLFSNGSCIAPPPKHSVPSNLRGCMIGRAVRDNPAMFHDIDRYFYGEKTNPCQTRREALTKYCQFLDQVYPRRCCDNDERITTKIPSPCIKMNKPNCQICKDLHQARNMIILSNNSYTSSTHKQIKISSRVIDRSLKPILGIFFGMPKSKLFRRLCDTLSRNKQIRNCGPGFILQLALFCMPSEILDDPFIKTEDLVDETIPLHAGPSVACNNTTCHG